MMPAPESPDAATFPGYPRGWFAVATTDELVVGALHRMRYFGRELVGYRTGDGRPVVLEAHCPHLGAHVGHGGRVEGDCVRCPFHGFRFGPDGACVEVPYARSVPKGARLPALAALDRNGLVFVHHDPTGAAPSYEIPVVPETLDPRYTPWRHGVLRLRTHAREILENVVDVAHFAPVHKNVPVTFENEFVGHRAVQRSTGHGMGAHRDTQYSLVATYHGPGYQLTEMQSVVDTRLYNAHTMVDEDTVDLRFGVMIAPGSNDARFTDAYVDGYVEVLMHGFRQDARIWAHKRWRERPVLCDGDGPIGALRAWYAQFY